jgi:hypothetical protein
MPWRDLLKGIAILRVNLLGVPATFVTLSIDDYDLTLSWPPKTVPVFLDQGSWEKWHGSGIRMRMR